MSSFFTLLFTYSLSFCSFSPLYFLFITNFMNSLSLTNYLIFFSHFLPVYLRKLPQFGMGGGGPNCYLHLRYLFRLISSHPYSSSGLYTRPIIYYSTSVVPNSFVAWAVMYFYHS